jgi:hypothetical protein
MSFPIERYLTPEPPAGLPAGFTAVGGGGAGRGAAPGCTRC